MDRQVGSSSSSSSAFPGLGYAFSAEPSGGNSSGYPTVGGAASDYADCEQIWQEELLQVGHAPQNDRECLPSRFAPREFSGCEQLWQYADVFGETHRRPAPQTSGCEQLWHHVPDICGEAHRRQEIGASRTAPPMMDCGEYAHQNVSQEELPDCSLTFPAADGLESSQVSVSRFDTLQEYEFHSAGPRPAVNIPEPTQVPIAFFNSTPFNSAVQADRGSSILDTSPTSEEARSNWTPQEFMSTVSEAAPVTWTSPRYLSTTPRLNLSPLSVPPSAPPSAPLSLPQNFPRAPTSFPRYAIPSSGCTPLSSAGLDRADVWTQGNNVDRGLASTCPAPGEGSSSSKRKHANKSRQEKQGIETVMLRGVPKTWGKTRLMHELDNAGYFGSYNFVYVPANSKTEFMESKGYAFVNFTHAIPTIHCQSLEPLRAHFEIQPATVQGLQANIDFFRHKGVRFTKLDRDFEFAPHVKNRGGFSLIVRSRSPLPINHA